MRGLLLTLENVTDRINVTDLLPQPCRNTVSGTRHNCGTSGLGGTKDKDTEPWGRPRGWSGGSLLAGFF